MVFVFRIVIALCLCMGLLSAEPNGTLAEPNPSQNATPPAPPPDAKAVAKLVGAWELVRKVVDGGQEEPLAAGAHTLMEFSENGVVIVTKTHKDDPGKPDTRPGKFSMDGDQLVMIDEQGNEARCPYRIEGDTLVVGVPQIRKEFYWRKVK